LPVADNSLHELLERMRGHLRSGRVDGDARQQLHSLMHDIEKRLGPTAPMDAGAGNASGEAVSRTDALVPTTPRLESLAVKFEASHPDLAATLREAVDLLGKAGL
jgi:Domain of unknown function (DUF4404)